MEVPEKNFLNTNLSTNNTNPNNDIRSFDSQENSTKQKFSEKEEEGGGSIWGSSSSLFQILSPRKNLDRLSNTIRKKIFDRNSLSKI